MPTLQENKINYIEIQVKDIAASKTFFANLFAWEFTDYGPEYCSFDNAGIDGGFYKSDNNGFQSEHSPLVVFYSRDIDAIKEKVMSLSGTIVKDTFSFPGGYRFHFSDANNNEYAIWTDTLE